MSNRVSRRQAGRWAAQEQQQYHEQAHREPVYAAPPPPTTPAGMDMETKLARLKELGELREQGILNDAEFETQKSRILNG